MTFAPTFRCRGFFFLLTAGCQSTNDCRIGYLRGEVTGHTDKPVPWYPDKNKEKQWPEN